jgi:hypothetical protein
MMEDNVMPNEGIRMKFTGDIRDEFYESLYRSAASGLVNLVWVQGIDRLRARNAIKRKLFSRIRRWLGNDQPRDDNTIESLLTNLIKNKPFGEAAISFALAIVFEVVPMLKIADDMRKRLAYNLRVRAYEKLEEAGFRHFPRINYLQDAAERAILEELDKRGLRVSDLKARVENASKANETTEVPSGTPANG